MENRRDSRLPEKESPREMRESARKKNYLFAHFRAFRGQQFLCWPIPRLSELHRGSVSKNLGRRLTELRRIISHRDDRVGMDLVSVPHHTIECFHSRFFADDGELFDVAAGDRF